MIAERIKYLKECMDDIVSQNPGAIPLYIGDYRPGEPHFYITNHDQNLTKNNKKTIKI